MVLEDVRAQVINFVSWNTNSIGYSLLVMETHNDYDKIIDSWLILILNYCITYNVIMKRANASSLSKSIIKKYKTI